MPYAHQVTQELKALNIRVEVDDRNEKIGKLIRDTELEKVPYMLIIGEKEMNEHTVAVRRHGKGDIGTQAVAEFAEKVAAEVNERIDK